MVLESLIKPWAAEQKPINMLFYGALYASIAVFLSLWIFRDQASMIMVFLTVLACVPLIYTALVNEEKKDIKLKSEISILKHHGKILKYLLYLFLGFVIAFSLWFIFLPGSTVETLFHTQLTTIAAINNNVTAGAYNTDFLWAIIANNLKVLLFCLFFSFFYGAGAIFILTWNASVIAGAVGTFVKTNIETYAASVGLIKAAGYMHIISLGLVRYMTHGIFEILAYFVAGLAGGLISVAVLKHDLRSEQFKIVMKDAMVLMILSGLLIVAAGLVEVYVTPMIVR